MCSINFPKWKQRPQIMRNVVFGGQNQLARRIQLKGSKTCKVDWRSGAEDGCGNPTYLNGVDLRYQSYGLMALRNV